MINRASQLSKKITKLIRFMKRIEKAVDTGLLASVYTYTSLNRSMIKEKIPQEVQKEPSLAEESLPIFAVVGLTAVSRYLEIEDDKPYLVLLKEKLPISVNNQGSYTFERAVSYFVKLFKKCYSKHSTNSADIGVAITKEEDKKSLLVELNLLEGETTYTKAIRFMRWPAHKSIHEVLEKKAFNLERAVFDLEQNELFISMNNSFVHASQFLTPTYSSSQLLLAIEPLAPVPKVQLASSCLEVLEYAIRVNANSYTKRLSYYNQEFSDFVQQCLHKAFKKQDTCHDFIKSGLHVIAQSDHWYECFLTLLDYQAVPLDILQDSTQSGCQHSSIPFRPSTTEKLLKRFQSKEHTFPLNAETQDLQEALTTSNYKILAWAISLIGDLLEFRESKSYFNYLLKCLLGTTFSIKFMQRLGEEQLYVTEELVAVKTSGIDPENWFSLTNAGQPFITNCFELRPKKEDLDCDIKTSIGINSPLPLHETNEVSILPLDQPQQEDFEDYFSVGTEQPTIPGRPLALKIVQFTKHPRVL